MPDSCQPRGVRAGQTARLVPAAHGSVTVGTIESDLNADWIERVRSRHARTDAALDTSALIAELREDFEQ